MRSQFEVHKLNEAGQVRARAIAEAFDDLADVLDEHVPDGREKAIVMTKLEEACFFAKKGMARQVSHQE